MPVMNAVFAILAIPSSVGNALCGVPTRAKTERHGGHSLQGSWLMRWYSTPAASRSIQLVRAVRVVLVADLIDRLRLALAAEEPVRRVEHQARLVADVAVGVDDPRRHDQQHRPADADDLDLAGAARQRT